MSNNVTQVGARTRVGAFLLDYLVILAYLIVLAGAGLFLTLGPFGDAWSTLTSTPARKDLLAFFTTVVPVAAYFSWSEGSTAGATWGKKRLGIRVVGSRFGPLSGGQAVVRSVAKFAPWQMAHTALIHIPGFPMAPQDPPTWSVWILGGMWVLVVAYLFGLTRLGGRRTLYDRISSTQVIWADASRGSA